MYFVSPLGALFRGLVAGAVGSYVQTVFLKRTASLAPPTPKDVFTPPEEEQQGELPTSTVARRTVEGMLRRGPLSPEQKKRGGNLVHYAFGAAWGGLYGLSRESFPSLASPLGSLAWGALVWGASDNLLLPAFKLGAWPNKYPAKMHGYYLAAHLAYGAGLSASYELMRRQLYDALAAGLWAIGARRAVGKRLPKRARPAARYLIDDLAWLLARKPIKRLQDAATHA